MRHVVHRGKQTHTSLSLQKGIDRVHTAHPSNDPSPWPRWDQRSWETDQTRVSFLCSFTSTAVPEVTVCKRRTEHARDTNQPLWTLAKRHQAPLKPEQQNAHLQFAWTQDAALSLHHNAESFTSCQNWHHGILEQKGIYCLTCSKGEWQQEAIDFLWTVCPWAEHQTQTHRQYQSGTKQTQNKEKTQGSQKHCSAALACGWHTVSVTCTRKHPLFILFLKKQLHSAAEFAYVFSQSHLYFWYSEGPLTWKAFV